MRYQSALCEMSTRQLVARLVHPTVFQLIEADTDSDFAEMGEDNHVFSWRLEGKNGQLTVRQDGIRVLIEGVVKGRHILRCAIRDRQLDGTEQSSPLTFFPNVDPACNRLAGPGFQAAELSIYSWDPNTYLAGLDIEGTIGHFIADPDHYIFKDFKPRTFFALWEQAFFLGRAPWQAALPMQGVAPYFVNQSAALLKDLGYHRVDAVPSWYNVARFFHKLGFAFTYGEHRLAFEAIAKGLAAFGNLDRAQQAWLVALQNIPEGYLPPALRLPARWAVTHTNEYWVRMHKDLSPFAIEEAHTGALTARIIASRQTQSPDFVLHTSSECPCIAKLGASSPAVTSPAAAPGAEGSR